MASRRTSLALVLALLAGMAIASWPRTSSLTPHSPTCDGANSTAQLRRAGKRLEVTERDHRRTSRELPLGVPASTFVVPRTNVVAIIESIVPPSPPGHPSGPVALARAPPAA